MILTATTSGEMEPSVEPIKRTYSDDDTQATASTSSDCYEEGTLASIESEASDPQTKASVVTPSTTTSGKSKNRLLFWKKDKTKEENNTQVNNTDLPSDDAKTTGEKSKLRLLGLRGTTSSRKKRHQQDDGEITMGREVVDQFKEGCSDFLNIIEEMTVKAINQLGPVAMKEAPHACYFFECIGEEAQNELGMFMVDELPETDKEESFTEKEEDSLDKEEDSPDKEEGHLNKKKDESSENKQEEITTKALPARELPSGGSEVSETENECVETPLDAHKPKIEEPKEEGGIETTLAVHPIINEPKVKEPKVKGRGLRCYKAWY